MNNIDNVYKSVLAMLLSDGEARSDRTGTGTRSIFGAQLRVNLLEGFPLLTTKLVHFPSVRGELLWMLSGSTNVHDLRRFGVTIWDEWADENGDLGPIYGEQWRAWGTRFSEAPNYAGIDQIAAAIDQIRADPDSRRIVISAWNAEEIFAMKLPPCHMMFQFSVRRRRFLCCHVFMRSCDAFLGLPFNIAQYALLTHMIAQVTGYEAGDLVMSFSDLHLYENHTSQALTQMEREPRVLPRLVLNKTVTDIDSFRVEDIAIDGYDPHPKIPAPVAV